MNVLYTIQSSDISKLGTKIELVLMYLCTRVVLQYLSTSVLVLLCLSTSVLVLLCLSTSVLVLLCLRTSVLVLLYLNTSVLVSLYYMNVANVMF